jgi:hypothetical protein
MRCHFMKTAACSLLLAASSTAAAEGQNVQFLGMHSQLPAAWVPEKPVSSMRVLQDKVPGAQDKEGAQFVVYYFGLGQGGSLEANVARWKSQFSRPGGGEVEPVVTKVEGSKMPATLVELRGSYARGMGMGQEGKVVPDQMLLAAVVETPKGNLYPQLHGPAEVVAKERQSLVRFIKAIELDATP